MSNNQGGGTVLPISSGETRQTGATGHVLVNGAVVQGTNVGGGRVQTSDGKVHG